MKQEDRIVSLTYEFTEEDVDTYLTDYTTYYYAKLPAAKRRFLSGNALYYSALFLLPVLAFFALKIWLKSALLSSMPAVMSAQLWKPLLDILWKRWNRQRLRKMEGFLGPYRVRVHDEGFSSRTKIMEWTLFWPQVEDIIVAEHHVLFVMKGHKGDTVFPVPRHAFAHDQECRAFIEQASVFWKASALIPE